MNDRISTPTSLHRNNRRQFMKLVGMGTVALAFGMAGTSQNAAASTATEYRTTANLNLRSGPSTSHAVILVMPAGSLVTYTGSFQGSFFKVVYGSTTGWAHVDYLAPATAGDPGMIGDRQTSTAVNLRSGPSTSHQVLRVVPGGTRIQVSNTVNNGFRYVVHDGLAGWMYDAYIVAISDDQGGNYRTTTAYLNLRAEPSLSGKILTVMPYGAKVQLLHMQVGDFVNVNYNGMQGWAHIGYLA